MSAPFIVGVTFKDTDLDKREALTLPVAEMPQHLEHFVSDAALTECIILCTCNRIEFYAVPSEGTDVEDAAAAVRRLWAECRNLTKESVEDEGRLWTGEDAVRHTLSVMASLDSLVVGEAQICLLYTSPSPRDRG